jgi:hypothetical protein
MKDLISYLSHTQERDANLFFLSLLVATFSHKPKDITFMEYYC